MAWLEVVPLAQKMLTTNCIEFGDGAKRFTVPHREDKPPEYSLTVVKVLHMVAQ